MDILTNLQEYGVIGAAFTIVLMILKYNGKQGWKESLGLSDREKFFHLFSRLPRRPRRTGPQAQKGRAGLPPQPLKQSAHFGNKTYLPLILRS